jgi:succinoglycan biosynthesis transport protein ExoP
VIDSLGGSAQQGTSLRATLKLLYRRRLTIVFCMLAVPALAAGFSLRQQKLYQAQATVLLSRQNLANEVSGVPDQLAATPNFAQIAATQAGLAHTTAVAASTLSRLRLQRLSPQQLLSASTVSADSNSDFLTFAVTDHNPALAVRLTTAMASEYVAYQLHVENAPLVIALQNLQSQLNRLAGRSSETSLRDQLLTRQLQLQNIATLQTSTAYLAEPATSATLVQPKLARNVAVGIVLGILVGVGLVLLWNTLDTRIESADEVGEALETPILARLPTPPGSASSVGQVTILDAPSSPMAESVRLLAIAVEFAVLTRQTRLIACISGLEGEGKTTTISELGVALASRGANVILVDLDLRKPKLHKMFGIPPMPGITDLVLGSGQDHASSTSPERLADLAGSLTVVPVGTRPPVPAEFVAVPQLGDVLRAMANRADYVLIDTAPILRVSDTASLLRFVDAVFVVARLGMVTRKTLGEVRRTLDALSTPSIGSVITAAESDTVFAPSYGYYQSDSADSERTEQSAAST